jgi:hypothetical protein
VSRSSGLPRGLLDAGFLLSIRMVKVPSNATQAMSDWFYPADASHSRTNGFAIRWAIPQGLTLSHLAPASFPVTAPGCTENGLDADLQHILNDWPTLPEALRAGILAMIEATMRDG